MTYHTGRQPHRTYYWVITRLGNRLVIIGPKDTESDANTLAYEKLDGEFEVLALPTRDKSRATSIIKARRLEVTGDLESSIQRAKHQI